MIYKRVSPHKVTNFLYISYKDKPTCQCKTQKDTNSWVLGVTVATATEAKDGTIAKLT